MQTCRPSMDITIVIFFSSFISGQLFTFSKNVIFSFLCFFAILLLLFATIICFSNLIEVKLD